MSVRSESVKAMIIFKALSTDVLYVYVSSFSPTIEVDVNTLSSDDPEDIKAAVDEALSEAVSDGKVGNVEIQPNSLNIEEPQRHKGMDVW